MTESGRLSVVNPATGENIEEIPISSREEVDASVERAREGFREWQEFAGLDRAEVLHEISARMRKHADELAEVMTLEGGKPFIENRDEVTWTAACFDYYAEIARDSVGYLPAPIEAQQLALVVKEPVGTVACIVPWNYPLLLAAWKVAPALAAGNAVLLKPSEETPLATRRLAELMHELPDGLLQVMYGAGEVGSMPVRHPGVDMVAFTGSQETGRKVGLAAAERFYVMSGVADDFVEASREFVESLNIGDPMDRSTDIGPIINATGREKVERHVGDALERGAKLVAGGERYGEKGFYYKP